MDARRPLGVLATVTVLGLWLRVQGLSHLGLWRDDAWVALSSRVGISTAWRMGVTARGFMLAERAWTLLHAGSPTWAQLLPLALGVAGILAVYALARQFGLPSWWSIGCATVVALSPIAIVWSTHVKQYSTDLLLSCVLLGLGERARRVPIGLRLALLGTASLVSLVVSASVVPILVGVWLALAVVAAEQRSRRRAIVVAGGVTAALCGAFALAALSHLPTALHRYWQDEGRFVPTSSVRDLGRGVTRAVEALATGVVHLPSPLAVVGAVLVALLVVVGAVTSRAALAPAVAIGAAFVAAAASLVPLGTGRTDEVLYPAIVVTAALGLRGVAQRVAAAGGSRTARRVVAAAGATFVAYVVVAELVGPVRYPSVDVRRVADGIQARRRPGDVVYVDARTRYPWVLAESRRVALRFGPGWGAGFTVLSTQPDVVISPSQSWERPFSPSSVAAKVAAAPRVWFVGSGEMAPDLAQNSDYQALLARGWRARSSLQASGAYLVLLTRPARSVAR